MTSLTNNRSLAVALCKKISRTARRERGESICRVLLCALSVLCESRLLALALFVMLAGSARPQATILPPARYAAAVEALDKLIVHEVAAKQLPPLSIALLDDQTLACAK